MLNVGARVHPVAVSSKAAPAASFIHPARFGLSDISNLLRILRTLHIK
jgi:hypothetical protein